MEVSRVAEVRRQATFTTQSGSTYLLRNDGINVTWQRTKHSPESNRVRTQGGRLLCWPIIRVGEEALMLGPPLDITYGARFIYTSKVLSYEENAC